MDNNDRILGIKEIQRLYDINDEQEKEIDQHIESIEDDMQIRTMSLNMCKIMEGYIGLQAQDDDTVEEKRFRIQGAENERTPYTIEILKKRLDEMVGSDRVIINLEDGVLRVEVALESKKSVSFIKNLIDQIVPLDMMIETSMIWNTYQKVHDYTHEYLANKTHCQIKEDVLYERV